MGPVFFLRMHWLSHNHLLHDPAPNLKCHLHCDFTSHVPLILFYTLYSVGFFFFSCLFMDLVQHGFNYFGK